MMEVAHGGCVLDGARNFRDVGGLLTADGRKVRSGRIFRSNGLSKLSDGDVPVLDTLGIGAIFDLRSRAEREAAPTQWGPQGAITHVFPAGRKRRLVDMARDHDATADGARALMHAFYREMPHTMGHAFGGIMLRLHDARAPCIIHCSAGKDRTGVGVAILLAALGVQREEVVKDYVRSSSVKNLEDDMTRAIMASGGRHDLMKLYQPEAISIMMDASSDYIAQAFDSIDEVYGSLDAYLHKHGVTNAVVESLRADLLEGSTPPSNIFGRKSG